MSTSLLLFLGSGASDNFGLPTMRKLVDNIQKEIEKGYQEKVILFTNIRDFSTKEYGYVDIEIVFTILKDIYENKVKSLGYTSNFLYSLATPSFDREKYLEKNQELAKGLLNDIKRIIRKKLKLSPAKENSVKKTYGLLFDLLSKKLNWIQDSQIHCSIYTTNYDKVIETYFLDDEKQLADYWKKEKGLEYLDIDNVDTDRLYYKLIKLHGSLDWFQRSDGKIVKLESFKGAHGGKKIENEMMIFPIQQKDLYLYPWYDLFRAFKLSLRKNKKWLVIGYSFNDEYIKNIFIQEFQFNDNTNFIIVSPYIEVIKNKFLDTKKFDEIKFLELKFEENNIQQIVDIVNS